MLFVTGTGTEVGKTWFSVALIATWRSQGHTVRALKPFETGCDPAPLDALALAEACGEPQLAMLKGLFRARRPVAPWAALKAGEGPLDLPAIEKHLDDVRGSDRVLVEGAGGPLVPLTKELDVADWAVGKFDSVVLVAADQLGVLSHTLTAVESLVQRELPLEAVVLNATESSDASQEANLEILQARLDVPVYRQRWQSRIVDEELASSIK